MEGDGVSVTLATDTWLVGVDGAPTGGGLWAGRNCCCTAALCCGGTLVKLPKFLRGREVLLLCAGLSMVFDAVPLCSNVAIEDLVVQVC